MRMNVTAMLAVLALFLISIPAADARGGHGFRHGGFGHGVHATGGHGAGFSGDQRHANDTYVNAASEEEDKLLDTKIKSICRGC